MIKYGGIPEIVAETLETLRARGGPNGKWAVYQNVDFNSGEFGRIQFLMYGPGCTFETPPEKCPDTVAGFGWRYLHAGFADLAKGEIVEVEP